ncbi:MAG: cytochrome c biogenesis protein CcdA [Anaerolineae bacterium]|nr:cytochrome c biogenesis protein CcdA [Anaerolineae bacterium]
MEVSIGLAFLSGLASFLSPCVLSLLPVYVGYLGGQSIATPQAPKESRWQTFVHGVGFVAGFSLIFILMGVGVSAVGAILDDLRFVLVKLGGVIVVIFGLHMTGIIRIPFLYYDFRLRGSYDRREGIFSSFLLGVFFSAGWSPCIGPVLGAILTLALNGGSVVRGALLLFVYSVGLAVPFLLAALGVGWLVDVLKRYRKIARFVEVVMGGVLIVVGILLFTGVFERFFAMGALMDLTL